MDAVNELSCEFAANVIAKMRKDKDIEPQVALSVIRNFYDALRPLMRENNRSIDEKVRKANAEHGASSH